MHSNTRIIDYGISVQHYVRVQRTICDNNLLVQIFNSYVNGKHHLIYADIDFAFPTYAFIEFNISRFLIWIYISKMRYHVVKVIDQSDFN